MDVRLLLVLFFLVSCLPTAQVSKGNLASTEGETSGGPNGGGVAIPEAVTSWNYLNATGLSITINVSNLNNAYIVGSGVETFLSSSSNFSNMNYCLVSSFSLGGVPYELRTRIVPISYYDFTSKRTVRVLRVDFNDVPNSASLCGGTLNVRDVNGNYITDLTSPPTPRYDPSQVCPTCTSTLTSTKVRIFKKDGDLFELASSAVNLISLGLKVDPNNNSTGGIGSCTNSECVSRGFNCCLDNQCVNDGATRPSARTQYYSQWQVAEQERIQNPLAYINYPHIYYVCGTTVPPGNGSTGGSSGGGSGGYDAAFEQLKKDYVCVEHIKSQSKMDPFHNEILSRATPYTPAANCLTASTDEDKFMHFKKVIERLYKTCGCSRSELSAMIESCPAYEYDVILTDANGVPTKIDCYTPPTSPTIPSQQTVTVNSRSAPHRFFESVNGLEKDIVAGDRTYVSGGVTTEYVQEGDAFEYLDSGKVLPVQADFGMNSILGSMKVSLDQALPAKTVNVELDQVYLIATTSGYYTPCPSCAKDSWLSSLSAFPSSASGTGLQAVGHTTSRDSLSTNFTGGNYEDTIFGRACWLPPTMIPFTHLEKSTVKEQREERLKAQAALYVNGYQRDWYGFNKGALIGSFDGVTWFAIGKGRIVKSTSKKLFLAINAPFADLASPTQHIVNVYNYDGQSGAAQVDYDPEFHQSHPYQNEAGNCQAHHMCETDTDCVTKLGWEYACSDVRELQTKWPTFDVEGNEKAGAGPITTIDQILQQKRFPSSSTKRCVYRGAGALCITNSANITDLNKRKNFTCAPNFYCSNMNSGSNFNSKVARYAANLEDIPVPKNHIFGQDANILGRPLHYNGESILFPSSSRTSIIENIKAYEPLASGNAGVCRPGKALPTTANQVSMSNPFNQHMIPDGARRSDFINQIASCNSTLFNEYRYSSCPVIGSDGNYEMFSSTTLPAGHHLRARNQNSCGLDSLHSSASLGNTADNLLIHSAFRSIEAKPLNDQLIAEPTFARDACMRRAGQVCHTDLDCSPGKLHGEIVDTLALAYFGNESERSFYRESLVCGQSNPKPLSSDAEAFKNYDMSLNRCCREVGKDLTTVTTDTPRSTRSGEFETYTEGLKASLAPGINPKDPKRYSRLATVENLGTTTRPILTANHNRTTGFDIPTGVPNILQPQQWKTLNEANSETCCGGGWIRKFSDGSNDWTKRDRLYFDVSNFSCLNSRTALLTNPADMAPHYGNSAFIAQNLISQDYGEYCRDATHSDSGCAQYSFKNNSNTEDAPVSNAYGSFTINTVTPNFTGGNLDNYFLPKSADNNSAVIIDYSATGTTARRNITMKMPSFVSLTHFDNLYPGSEPTISMVSHDGAALNCTRTPGLYAAITGPTSAGTCAAGTCCYAYDKTTRILKAASNGVGAFTNKRVGIRFSVGSAGSGGLITRASPGSNAYYLSRLGRLELSGIPQIAIEPLYCSDNYDRLVPGIFKPGITTFSDFINPNNSFSSAGKYYTTHHALEAEPVFSADEFKCCMPLGKTTTDTSKCCSGFGLPQDTTNRKFTCALPAGTDLMVYFNSFVSNEGRGADKPGGGLVENDFNPLTGEPKLETAVNSKIMALGREYCEKGAFRQGGAFGLFEPEPQTAGSNLSNRIYGIVDSSRDNGQISNAGATYNTGYTAFINGFRWNHHIYCAD